RTSPELEKATTDGVVRAPSALGMTTGSPPSRTATHELVVPRSMPTARAMGVAPDYVRVQVSLERGWLKLTTPRCPVQSKLSPGDSALRGVRRPASGLQRPPQG